MEINSKKSILILGGNGLVGSSCFRILSESNRYNVNKSTRKDTDLFDFQSTSKLINDLKPDILINAAAKVGGIYANNTQRVQFLIENVIKSCVKEQCPVSICGELANDIKQTRKFLKMGLRELSTNVSDILKMKEAISKIEL